MRVIPLYKPSAVLNAWSVLTPGVERVLEFANGDDDLTLILNQILAGELLLWIVLDKSNNYCGFTTTYIRTVGTNPAHKLLVFNHTYKKPEADQVEFLNTCLDAVEKHAKEQGCNSLRLYSLRPLKRMVKAYGFTPSYQEFVKEL